MKPILDAPWHSPPPAVLPLEHSIATKTALNVATASRGTLTRSRWWLWVSAACLVTVMVFVGCLGLGTQAISYSTIIAVIMGAMAGSSLEQGLSDPTSVILLHVRMPRVLLAFFVGGWLAWLAP